MFPAQDNLRLNPTLMTEPVKINKIAYIEKSIKTLAWIEKNEKQL